MKLLTLLSLFLLSLTQSSSHPNPNLKCSLPEDKGSTLQVIHIYSPCSPFKPNKLSWTETVSQMLTQDTARFLYLSSLVARKSVSPVGWGREVIQSPRYLVRVKVGTPPQSFLMALDTSNDAAWLPCHGCLGCPNSSGASNFASQNSTSFKPIACGTPHCSQVTNPNCLEKICTFNQTYGGSTISASLSQDTVSLARDPIPGYIFGCIQKATGNSIPPQGLLGLGRGPLSVMDQSQSLYKSTFSYCLPSFSSSNFTGSLKLGPTAQPKRIGFTPLLRSPRRPTLYYVNLVGVKVGRKTVDIPPSALAFDSATGSGTIIDSGTIYTRLVTPAYTAVRDEFRRQIGKAKVTSLGGFDTCYTVPITVPTITFMFQGLNMTVTQDNFILRSVSTPTACLAMAAAPDNVNSALNIIASMQQQNHRVLFDIPKSRVGISRELCS